MILIIPLLAFRTPKIANICLGLANPPHPTHSAVLTLNTQSLGPHQPPLLPLLHTDNPVLDPRGVAGDAVDTHIAAAGGVADGVDDGFVFAPFVPLADIQDFDFAAGGGAD